MPQPKRSHTESEKNGRRIWNIAVYIRLSREDARSLDESESITNQRAILREHIAAFQDGDEYSIAGEYIDDGISGTTDDDRAGFQEMLRDIKNGRINCVIVKDLARSFRNYSDQGYYLDDWFPRHNVRFISLFHQPLDSFKEPRAMKSIAVPIQGVMNENHCAETSEKVRKVFDIKRRNGQHIGSFAPFGYLKNPENKNALIIDEEAAAIVREIFELFLEGMSKNGIVRCLNERGIPCPSVYKREQGLKYQNPNADPADHPLWCASTVHGILKNRMYCGDMVQGRCRIKSYKVHIQEAVPEEEWYIVERTHAPIIGRETFEKVQRLLKKNTRSSPRGHQIPLFSGFLRCADCRRAMTRSQVKGTIYYYCRTYKDQSRTACTKHSLLHGRLESAVLWAIRQQIYLSVDSSRLIRQLDKAPAAKKKSASLMSRIEQKQKELAKIMQYKQSIYQDWKDGELSPGDYQYMKEDYSQKETDLKHVLETLKTELEKESGTESEDPLLASFRKEQNITELSRDVLMELVDHIQVYEGGRICIVFRFSDALAVRKDEQP